MAGSVWGSIKLAKRKLTTVFCADVDGYTNLMAHDEEATLVRLQRARGLMRELFDAHNGTEINTWGDAVIAEFGSVVEAVRCGVAFQDAMETENLASDAAPMKFRVGINLGDVMDDGNSIYGDGVNSAARLEAACEPGGVLISDTVHSLVHRNLAMRFVHSETDAIKDGEAPVSGYRVVRDRKNSPRRENLKRREIDPTTRNPILRQTSSWIERIENWISLQPKSVRTSVGMIIFFFAINALFSGLSTPWFLFPSIPFALQIWRKRVRGDGADD